MRRKVLLGCGVVASVWWVAMDAVGSLRYPGYSYSDQTISELSAQGTPTRNFVMVFSNIPSTLLLIAFGIGVWRATGRSRAGRAAGALVVAEAMWGCVGGFAFPMATREVIAAGQDTLRNQLHAWYGIGMPLLFVLAISFGAGQLGKRFRYFSYSIILVMLVFGFMMGMQTGAMTANEQTPWMGIEERITGYAPMLWFVVLAVGLLRRETAIAREQIEEPAGKTLEVSRGGGTSRPEFDSVSS